MLKKLLIGIAVALTLYLPALAQEGSKPTREPTFSKERPLPMVLAHPDQLSLGMTFDQFSSTIRRELGPVKIVHDEDEEKRIVRVPGLRVFIDAYGELTDPDLIFFKTPQGMLLGVIQEDVSELSQPVIARKVANMMAAYGKPRISQSMDSSGIVSTTWLPEEHPNLILSLYKYSDGHLLFLLGNTKVSPALLRTL